MLVIWLSKLTKNNAAYLIVSKVRSRKEGSIYMGNHEENKQIINGPIVVIARILKLFVDSAAEEEVGTFYHTAIEIVPLHMVAIE